MPELPEIASRAREMKRALKGKTITDIETLQPKCLNVPEATFQEALVGAEILAVTPRGKWLQVETTQGWLLLNLGVGYSAAAGGPEARGRHFFHLFVGAPLLLTLLVDDLPVLVEPYWRPMLGEQTLHEVGMLIKYILPL